MNFKFTKKLIALIEIIIIGICIFYTINHFSLNIDQKNLEQDKNSKKSNDKLVKSIFKEIYGKNLWEKHGMIYIISQIFTFFGYHTQYLYSKILSTLKKVSI